MKKKVVIALFAVISLIGFTKNVYAEEVYYTTPNGIELTREEYNFLTSFYGEPYLNFMTREMYDEFVEDDIINSEVETVTYTEPQLALLNPSIAPNSTSHSTSAKTVQIAKACVPAFCIIDLQNTWHGSPSVRSWDNIGAFFDGVSLILFSHTYVDSTAGTEYFTNLVTESDGIGNSVELPSTGSNITISMAFRVSRGGTVYGSYQHAMQSTTLANSQNYTLDILGNGNVFLYNSTAIGIYDDMNGVDIDV